MPKKTRNEQASLRQSLHSLHIYPNRKAFSSRMTLILNLRNIPSTLCDQIHPYTINTWRDVTFWGINNPSRKRKRSCVFKLKGKKKTMYMWNRKLQSSKKNKTHLSPVSSRVQRLVAEDTPREGMHLFHVPNSTIQTASHLMCSYYNFTFCMTSDTYLNFCASIFYCKIRIRVHSVEEWRK